MARLNDLQEGDLCKFVYKQQGGDYRWRKWECTAVYLGVGERYRSGDVILSYRPLAGTSYLRTENILDISIVTPSEQRRGKRGDEKVRLPIRVPGPALEVPA